LRAASEDRSSGEVGRTSEASVASAGASVGNSLGASSTSVVVATIESALRDISAAREDVIATQFLSAKEARVASANTSVDGGVLGAGSIEVSVAAEQRAFVKISTSTKDIGAGKDLSSIVPAAQVQVR
jgi:lactate dehydrogenase-like 2-hydroxyacid dehydrogenase